MSEPSKKNAESPNPKCKWEGGAHHLRPAFRALGLFVGQRPKTTILLVLMVVVSCSLGCLSLDTSLTYKIWFDVDSPSYKQWTGPIARTWPVDWASSEVLLEALPSSANSLGILSGGCLSEVSRLRHELVSRLPPSACGRTDGDCEHSLFRELERENVSTDDAVNFLSLRWDGTGLPLGLSRVVGTACCGGTVSSAVALKIHFHFLQPSKHRDTYAFDEAVVNVCEQWQPSRGSCPGLGKPHCSTSNSYKWEQERALASDQKLMGIAIVLMLVYTAVALGRAANCTQSKVLLGSSVVMTVMFSLAVSFGVGTILGVGFSQLSMLAIFILLGVGIDDAFIINDAFERTDKSLEASARIADTLAEVGPAVLLTSATDFMAFMVGLSYRIRAIQWFCATAGIAVFTVFLLQITLFAALTVLNSHRENSKRCDVCPCLPACHNKAAQKECTEVVETCHSDCGELRPSQTSSPEAKHFPSAAAQKLESLLRRPIVRLPILWIFAMLLAVAIFLVATKVSKGIKDGDFVPSDSYLHSFWDANDRHFGRHVPIGLYATPADLSRRNDVELLKTVADRLASSESNPRQPTWMDAFLSWRNRTGAAASIQIAEKFINSTEGQRYKDDVVPEEGEKVTARAWIWVTIPVSMHDQIQFMQNLRETYDNEIQNRIPGFVWSDVMLFTDRDDKIDNVIVTSQAFGLAAVGLTCLLLLPPLAAGAALFSIVLVNLNIIGFVSIWGVQMSVSTAAILVLAMGFSVDYAAHIAEGLCSRARAQMCTTDAHAAKVTAEVLCTTGVSVLHGGASTLLAVLLLALSDNKGFQDMFKCFFLMVIFGLLHGLVLLPVMFVSQWELTRYFADASKASNNNGECQEADI